MTNSVNIIHNQQWKAETFSSKVRNKTGMTTLTTFIQNSIGVLARVIRQEKEIKKHPKKK